MKPLGRKAYGSTPHLIGSRVGPADHHVHAGQHAICTVAVRDRHDRIIVTEKLDGSCVAVARIGSDILALGRAGHLAASSRFQQHHLFADWVRQRQAWFIAALDHGELMAGEWLAQAHGTRYRVGARRLPFVPFDVIGPKGRLPHDAARERFRDASLTGAHVLHDGGALSIAEADLLLGAYGHHGAIDRAEGAVWRVERKGAFDFIAKWVRAEKVDGALLPEISGGESIWNWWP